MQNSTPAYRDFIRQSKISVPVYPLTRSPGYHWFGYYDKFQTDPNDRCVLGMRVDFEHRTPRSGDEIKIGMLDLQQGNRWIELGTSNAWNWQQGCMLQWLPGSSDEVLWNDRSADRFVCHILDIKTMRKRTLPVPVYTVSPDGAFGFSVDFERIQDVRAGYGYSGVEDKYRTILAPENTGLWKISLADGSKKLIVSLQEIAAIPYAPEDLTPYKHYFNAISINPGGTRVAFLHRWSIPGEAARVSPLGTRFLTAAVDGGDIHVLNDSRMTSHFCWKNDRQILAWANRPEIGNRFYLFEDMTEKKYEIVGEGVLKVDGHCSFLRNDDWIMNDTYPDQNRQVELYLFNARTGEKIVLGKFFMDPKYTGEWRVDLHPRQTRDRQKVIIDCPVGVSGRQMLLLDLSGLNLRK
ncbi:hypothetical protein JXJ21_09770 [candidate division KSB1 bacterium]|nr:hypothetical protein [candidate division KSB1 bacterium]